MKHGGKRFCDALDCFKLDFSRPPVCMGVGLGFYVTGRDCCKKSTDALTYFFVMSWNYPLSLLCFWLYRQITPLHHGAGRSRGYHRRHRSLQGRSAVCWHDHHEQAIKWPSVLICKTGCRSTQNRSWVTGWVGDVQPWTVSCHSFSLAFLRASSYPAGLCRERWVGKMTESNDGWGCEGGRQWVSEGVALWLSTIFASCGSGRGLVRYDKVSLACGWVGEWMGGWVSGWVNSVRLLFS